MEPPLKTGRRHQLSLLAIGLALVTCLLGLLHLLL
jgi:hypothetical protein